MDSRSPRCCGRRTRTPARTPSSGSSAPGRLRSAARSATTRTSWEPAHARPAAGGAEHAERVRREALWLREHGLEPRLFCGGGWYMDEGVAAVLAELGYADCTGTAFVPSYLDEGAPRLSAESPAWLSLPDGKRLLELPSTHSLGMAARAAAGSLPPYVHVYFHDTDLLTRKRRAALAWALAVLGRRCEVTDLDRLREASSGLPERTFALH